jgi:predicted dehydrogenase
MSPVQHDLGQSDRLRVGIVGCGGIGNSHARAYLANPQVELVGVVDVIA